MWINSIDLLVDICPHCNQVLKYCPNPYYIFICEKCKGEGYQRELKRGILVEKAEEEIRNLEEEIIKIKEYLENKYNVMEEKE